MLPHLPAILTVICLVLLPVRDEAVPKPLAAAIPKRPLQFEPNWGQAEPGVRFIAHGPGHRFLLRDNGIDLIVSGGVQGRDARVFLRWKGAETPLRLAGETMQQARSVYIPDANDPRWMSGVPQFQQLVAREICPNLDLVFRGFDGLLDLTFIMRPGANLGSVHFWFQGADEVSIGIDGELQVRAGSILIFKQKPLVFMERNGSREFVQARYTWSPDKSRITAVKIGDNAYKSRTEFPYQLREN